MFYDEARGLIYIVDGVLGYVYSDKDGLGECLPTITGIGQGEGGEYVMYSPITTTDGVMDQPTQAPFEICTDVVDMGTREVKAITHIHVGAETAGALMAAIDYRHDNGIFYTTPWVMVDRAGRAPIRAKGVEFRFRLKLAAIGEIRLDYMTAYGVQ